MDLLGHTLGTPDHTLREALVLFSEIGLDGAEVIWQDGYLSGLGEREEAAVEARRISDHLGLPILCLTPYMAEINSPIPAQRNGDLDRFRRCLDAAATVGAPLVRAYAGTYDPRLHSSEYQQRWELLCGALVSLGDHAVNQGVSICVENHFGTMADSAHAARRLMQDVDHPGVAILYDQANLSFAHQEDHTEAIPLQAEWIKHVQAKDFVFIDRDAPFEARAVNVVAAGERHIKSRVISEGEVPWLAILTRLAGIHYSGPISIEYEARWHPIDLPPPREGFSQSVKALREMWEAAEGASREPAVTAARQPLAPGSGPTGSAARATQHRKSCQPVDPTTS
jgi:L-ribulose-5-phosphate 3-epimerase